MTTIVSFCGGGIRGLLSATLLHRLYQMNQNILSNTTIFAGCSTGAGIVSQLLAGRTPLDIIENYQSQAPFYEKQSTAPNAPAYDIKTVFDVQWQLHGNADPALGSFTQQAVILAYDLGSSANEPWGPIIYNNLPSSPNQTVGIATAVTQSAAMPGMFAPYANGVDGGFANHDPTLHAIAVAMQNGTPIEDIAVIDIGTGLYSTYMAANCTTWGAQQWQAGDGNANDPQPLLVNGTTCPVLSLSLDGMTTTAVPQLAQMMLGNRYVSLNPPIPFIPENAWTGKQLLQLTTAANEQDLMPAVNLMRTYWDLESLGSSNSARAR